MNIPKGYVLVPVDPDEKMIRKGDMNYSWSVAKIYKAMIASAPPVELPAYEEAKERELFEVSHPVPEFVKWDDEFNQYLVSLYPGECDSEYGSLWDGWKACAKSRARSAE